MGNERVKFGRLRGSAFFPIEYVRLVYSAHLCLTLLHINTNELDTVIPLGYGTQMRELYHRVILVS